jgi:thiamine-monophosphate kinase
MELPQPRVALGCALRGIATSAIDVSDGLLGDLSHILARSQVGASIAVDAVPRSAILAAQPQDLQRVCSLAGGDDYELVFTAPAGAAAQVRAAAAQAGVPVTHIGRIDPAPGLRLLDAAGAPVPHTFGSFDHFRA